LTTIALEDDFSRPYTTSRTYTCCVRLSPPPSSSVVCTECIVVFVTKRCVLEQKLPLAAYRKSYMRNRLVPKWMTLTFV